MQMAHGVAAVVGSPAAVATRLGLAWVLAAATTMLSVPSVPVCLVIPHDTRELAQRY